MCYKGQRGLLIIWHSFWRDRPRQINPSFAPLTLAAPSNGSGWEEAVSPVSVPFSDPACVASNGRAAEEKLAVERDAGVSTLKL